MNTFWLILSGYLVYIRILSPYFPKEYFWKGYLTLREN